MEPHLFRSTSASATNADCTFRVPALTRATTRLSAATRNSFWCSPLHDTEIETLVAEHEQYWVVRKTGEAGEYVEHLDPRSR